MEEYQAKDNILGFLKENRSMFNASQIRKDAELDMEDMAIQGHLQRMEQNGYVKRTSSYFKITGAGLLFHNGGGYANLFINQQKEKAKLLKREERLEVLDNLNLKNMKYDLLIKIVTAIVALGGLVLSIIAMSKK